jgi:hypothetical protein
MGGPGEHLLHQAAFPCIASVHALASPWRLPSLTIASLQYAHYHAEFPDRGEAMPLRAHAGHQLPRAARAARRLCGRAGDAEPHLLLAHPGALPGGAHDRHGSLQQRNLHGPRAQLCSRHHRGAARRHALGNGVDRRAAGARVHALQPVLAPRCSQAGQQDYWPCGETLPRQAPHMHLGHLFALQACSRCCPQPKAWRCACAALGSGCC